MHTGMRFFSVEVAMIEVIEGEVIGTGALEDQDSLYTLMQTRKSYPTISRWIF